MSGRFGCVRNCIAGIALIGSVLVSSGALAQQGCCEGGTATGANAWTAGNNWQTFVVDTPVFDPWAPAPSAYWPVTAEYEAGLKDGPAPYWWTHGEVEFGGRGFLNDPQTRGQIFGNTPGNPPGYVHLGQQSLAKYYEYNIIAPGAFGGGHVAMGSSDGLYQLDLWANNIGSNFNGFSDQSYLLEASKAGQHYVSVAWDSTPHIFSTTAQTPWLGVGTNNLTWPGAALVPAQGYAGIYPFLHPIDLGIQRDTISFAYRWTPEFYAGGAKDGLVSQYDFNTYYSHMDRYGTQPLGIVELNGFQPTQFPAPVNDTTQNFGVNGERIGNTPWGKYTFKLGYAGSIYTDNISSISIQNPFFPTVGTCTKPNAAGTTQGTANCVAGVESTPPSNQMNSVSATSTVDLPYNTRYAGTLSYTDMTQNAPFIDMTNNPNAANTPAYLGGVPWNQVNFGFINSNLAAIRAGNFSTSTLGTPVTSLHGDIHEILSNNVLTTKITPDLTSKLTYRFYDFDNGTPNILFPCWVPYGSTGYTTPSAAHPCGASENAIQSLSVSYMKQDAGAELNWRPGREWNFNAAYGFQRYDWSQADVNATNENSGKLSVDWKPSSWFDARLSGLVADRRYENYNYDQYVASIQFPCGPVANGTIGTCPGTNASSASWMYSPAYRQFMYDNRDQTKVQFLANIVVLPGVTVSPSVKYQDDYYGVNPKYNLGINDNSSVSAGVDLAYVVNPNLSLLFSYYWEKYHTLLYSTNGLQAFPAPLTGNLITTTDNEFVNTVTAAMNYVIIPNKLTFDVRASVSTGVDKQACSLCVSANPSGPEPVFPNNTTLFEHVEANLIYKFDPDLLANTGFTDMKLKLRYAWERNGVTNWQQDPLAPYTASVSTSALWLNYDNPNYNVHMVAASLVVKW